MNKNMRKILITSVMALTAWVMLVGCATAEERAARAAEQAKAVKTALQERNYQIAVNRMYPSRGASKTVSSGYTVEVRNDSLISYLPYFGRAYDVPYGGGNGLNFSAPFVVMRHWAELHQEGDFWCGQFQTDETDWELAELITNLQLTCQRYFFGAMAEQHFDDKDREASYKVQRRSKTIEGFKNLPEEFTVEDVMRCFGNNNRTTAQMRISRFQKDNLVRKKSEYLEKGKLKAIYQKTGNTIL
jgi:hypothetical protein